MDSTEKFKAELKVFLKETGVDDKLKVLAAHRERNPEFWNYLVTRHDFRERLGELRKFPIGSADYETLRMKLEPLQEALSYAERKIFGAAAVLEKVNGAAKGRITTDPVEKAIQFGMDVIQNHQRPKEILPGKVNPDQSGNIQWPGDRKGPDGGSVLVHAYERSNGHVNAYYRAPPGR